MMVNGPLDIYAIVLGVKMFDEMFNILASMGIIFLPLLIIFFQNITQPYESPFGNAASTSLRRVAIHFFMWVFTVMLFVAPTWEVETTDVVYKPLSQCAPQAIQSTYGHTGTKYDSTFAQAFHNMDFTELKLPIMMAFVLDGMSGFTNAAIESLGCATDVQSMISSIDTTGLTPSLTQQVKQFAAQCYAPAKAKFYDHPPTSNYQQTMQEAGGRSDLSWIGSHVFQQLYYGTLYPTSPVKNPAFANDHYPGTKGSSSAPKPDPQPNTVQGGYPSCLTWWTDPQNGIEAQIQNLITNNDIAHKNPYIGKLSISTRIENWLDEVGNTLDGSKVTPEDVMVRSLLSSQVGGAGFGRTYSGWMHDSLTSKNSQALMAAATDGDSYVIPRALAQVGQGIDAMGSSIDRLEIQQEIPIIRAVLLAFGLTLGPLIILLGMATGRGIQVIFTYYFLIGSLLFMTFVEKFIHHLEVSLHASQSIGTYALSHDLVMYNLFTKLYFYGPMLYLALMSIAGIGMGSAVGGAFEHNVTGAGKGVAAKAAMLMPK